MTSNFCFSNDHFLFSSFPKVSDADESENAKLRFSLSGKDSRLFDVNRNNGVVTASKAFKEQISYDVTVDVQDEGVQHLKNKARLAVYLAEELVVPRYVLKRFGDSSKMATSYKLASLVFTTAP